MAPFHQSRKHIANSGHRIAPHPAAPEAVKSRKEAPQLASLLSVATCTDLNESIGTLLSGVQLSALSPSQLDELALVVSERGVVFFRHQDLTREDQIRVSERFGPLYEPSGNSASVHGNITSDEQCVGETTHSEWHASRTFDTNPPSYSILAAREDTEVGGETAWVSQYGLYDGLSKHLRRFLDELHAVHTSRLLYDTLGDTPTENHHPAVRTHPVTGLKALNVTPGSVTGFAELKRKESDKLLELLDYHMQAADEHSVRFKWAAGSVAIWDNRCTAHRSIPSSRIKTRVGLETTSLGEKPYFDKHTESREERVERLAKEARDEHQRLAEVKARYNNTPLRRIIQRQIHGDKFVLNTPEQLPKRRDSHQLSISDSNTEVGDQEHREFPELNLNLERASRDQKAHHWAKEVFSEKAVSVVEKEISPASGTFTRTLVKANMTPLRRIIQRQSSGSSVPHRRDWR